MTMKTVAEKIRLLRLQRGLSQENLADSLRISTTAYGDIERGKTDLTLSRLYQIAEILKVGVVFFIEDNTPSSFQQELQQLELEKLRIENEKLRLENQYIREKLAGRIIIDLIREKVESPAERPRIGFGQ